MPADRLRAVPPPMAHTRPGPFVEVSSTLLASGYRVRFRASGGSMRPAICDGDFITVAPVDSGRVAPGTVLVYQRLGRLFAHRLVGVATGGGEAAFICRGDAVRDCDVPVGADQILGEVTRIERSAMPPAWRALPDLRQLLFGQAEPVRRLRTLLAC